jgi:salicylate hydroxylase
MMPGRSALHFPINHGKILNIVAFVHTTEDWTDTERLTRPATREDALRDFAGSGRNVTSLLKLCKPNLDVWGIFHLGDNPLPFYARKRVCLIGDAAHATSPHHGAGAGICIEDAAVMASLLDDENVQTPEDVEVAFAVFDRVRRDRGNWLVQTSNFIGKCYGWQGEGVGKDFGKIEHEIQERLGKIADGDVPQMCEQARTQLRKQMIEAKL